MNEATTRTLTQMEKLVRNQHRDPRKVYMVKGEGRICLFRF